jgi:hypothetical protein
MGSEADKEKKAIGETQDGFARAGGDRSCLYRGFAHSGPDLPTSIGRSPFNLGTNDLVDSSERDGLAEFSRATSVTNGGHFEDGQPQLFRSA